MEAVSLDAADALKQFIQIKHGQHHEILKTLQVSKFQSTAGREVWDKMDT